MESRFKKLETEIVSGQDVALPDFLLEWLQEPKLNFISGEWVEATGRKVFSDLNPATDRELAWVALSQKEDIDRAVTAARSRFASGVWSQLSLKERAVVVNKLGDLILEHRAPLAILESLDTGKPIRESFEGDILRSASNFHFFAQFAQEPEILEFENRFEAWKDTHHAFREPLGVVALITPWNLPLYLETWKIAPALMMGNSIVLKPSELTPLTANYFAALTLEAGLPAGVFNVVNGFGSQSAGEFLASHPQIDAISFTGETATGRAIMRSAASGPTRVSFELGGKGATIVCEDADLDLAVSESLRAGFRNQGEICLATPRILVARKIYDSFVDAFVTGAKEIRVGNPLNFQTGMGALISREHWEKVMGYVCEVDAPGKILCGGDRPEYLDEGNFLAPTVITGLSAQHPISREEIFGPVVSIYPFDTEAEAIQLTNDTPYGLSASIYSRDLDRANRIAKQIQIGLVWINCWFARDLRVPFGGQKKSGVGREGGKHSLDFFSEWKSVCVRERDECR